MAAWSDHLGAVLVVGVLQLVQLLQVLLLSIIVTFLLLAHSLPLFRERLKQERLVDSNLRMVSPGSLLKPGNPASSFPPSSLWPKA